jgi:hypothetical protein
MINSTFCLRTATSPVDPRCRSFDGSAGGPLLKIPTHWDSFWGTISAPPWPMIPLTESPTAPSLLKLCSRPVVRRWLAGRHWNFGTESSGSLHSERLQLRAVSQARDIIRFSAEPVRLTTEWRISHAIKVQRVITNSCGGRHLRMRWGLPNAEKICQQTWQCCNCRELRHAALRVVPVRCLYGCPCLPARGPESSAATGPCR